MVSLKTLWLASSLSASRCRWFTRTGRHLRHLLTGRDDWTDKISQIWGDTGVPGWWPCPLIGSKYASNAGK